MTELTAKQVEEALNDDVLEDGFSELSWYIEHGYLTEVTIDGEAYPLEVLEEKTGGDGDWDVRTFIVFKVGEQVFRKTGHYMSHYGNDWDGPLVEVEPVEVTVTKWKEKK